MPGDPLRPLWDFDDLDATEARLRGALAGADDAPVRAEILTQLARVEGLRGNFEAGDALIDEATAAAGDSTIARARIDLERGRVRRSSGDLQAALPLFESAVELALEADASFIAVDAAHMAALAASDPAAFEAWTMRGIELAEGTDADYWLGPLLNNLGWERYDRGDYRGALEALERGLEARERDGTDAQAVEIARYAVGKALRALGRSDEAVPLLERAVAWAETTGQADGWFHEELAEEYAALGRDDDARTQARLALPLLLEADPAFAEDDERAGRMRAIAGD
jgi:tetratricopeptide (TPR) repeat protein